MGVGTGGEVAENRIKNDERLDKDMIMDVEEETDAKMACSPTLPQRHTPDQWLPIGRGNTPARRIPRGNCLYCHDNVT